jgi:hypothetical protein
LSGYPDGAKRRSGVQEASAPTLHGGVISRRARASWTPDHACGVSGEPSLECI